MAKEMKIIADNIGKEKYDDFVNEYLKQLESENDITLFGKRYGSYYYMHKGLVLCQDLVQIKMRGSAS
ncbi:hypothetical protein [Roseburia sp. 499]|uniref:hypothetical protein n=1 Tax=Roseburia sp. 499 TaxID=1261634 RepID=UPI0009531341|nr:hypothetical protein [Roseburia sp. 499]WVK68746.1 hypothetical protein BIV20_10170 [Roseburia sp. 499]